MQFFQFIQLYLCLLVAGTLAVTGWFFITRGRKEQLPNGEISYKGKIFKGWYFFFTKTNGKKRIYYTGIQLEQLHNQYLIDFPDNPFSFTVDGNSFLINTETSFRERRLKDFIDNKARVEIALGAKALVKGHNISFYKEYDDYVWPEYIRDPLAMCCTCFASIYGSIFYWGVISMSNGLFDWTENVVTAKVFFWISFCLSLAVLNTALAKKFN